MSNKLDMSVSSEGATCLKDWMFTASNGVEVRCVVRSYENPHMGNWSCGYCELPPGTRIDDDYNIDVHGGVTFHEGGWIGFDTNHSGDRAYEWPLERMTEETESMAEQVATYVPELALMAILTKEEV